MTDSAHSTCFARPENQELGQNCFRKYRETCARQEPKPNNAQCEEDDYPFPCTWKPARGIENQLGRTRFEYHNPQVSDSLYIEKVLKTLRQKLNCSENDKMLDLNTNVLI